MNPFAGATIKTITQWGIARTTINNVAFNAIHPLYKSAGATWQPWITANGYSTAIVLSTNSYIGATPNQNILVRKYYQIPYNYDTTAPVSAGVYLYSDPALTIPFVYTTGWINTNVYYTIMCSDPETGCICTGANIGVTCQNTTIQVPA